MVVSEFPVTVNSPVPMAVLNSMPVMEVATYDIRFCRVLPVTLAAVSPAM